MLSEMSTNEGKSQMITVFYDGKCELCSKEISHYQKIAPDGVFNWQDITQSYSELRAMGVGLADGLRRMHARDSDGNLHVGVDAFILMWKQLDRWRLLGFVISLPVIKQIAKAAYNLFANWRFSRLEHCQIAE